MPQTHDHDLSERDVEALTFIGRSFEAAQYQLHAAVFAGNAPTVVSRFTRRAYEANAISIHRHDVLSGNRLRLTSTGLDLLERFQPGIVDDVFVPRRPVALKDLEHTTFINDICVALGPLGPTDLHPAWLLQRRFGRDATVIPDVLAIWPPGRQTDPLVVACEVDLGCEPLQRVFLPKLYRLGEIVNSSATRALIAVFTRGRRRRLMIEQAVRPADVFHILELPTTRGGDSIRWFSSAFREGIAPLLYAGTSPSTEVLEINANETRQGV